ncbi:hypothetical protein MLD38_024265 [Melastoma candidum]|uniref:Uncharacterized protein n=1 Tax=Melastoma candidum TaxID=119954 RepID=A0ACB9NTA4_9MYRT|nr:hypothetical protein MLD38_024265 [Melastoma candidum]
MVMEGYAQYRRALVALALFMIVMLLGIKQSDWGEYQVGDQYGWSYDIDLDGWARGKTFRSGDILVFMYEPMSHNVVEVDKTGYDSCKPEQNK